MNALRQETENADKLNKKKFIEDSGITGSVGYGNIIYAYYDGSYFHVL